MVVTFELSEDTLLELELSLVVELSAVNSAEFSLAEEVAAAAEDQTSVVSMEIVSSVVVVEESEDHAVVLLKAWVDADSVLLVLPAEDGSVVLVGETFEDPKSVSPDPLCTENVTAPDCCAEEVNDWLKDMKGVSEDGSTTDVFDICPLEVHAVCEAATAAGAAVELALNVQSLQLAPAVPPLVPCTGA